MTRNQRFSWFGLAFPPRAVLPNPDGAINTQGERYQYAYLYAVEGVVPPVVGGSDTDEKIHLGVGEALAVSGRPTLGGWTTW